jgi:hypothetical protein
MPAVPTRAPKAEGSSKRRTLSSAVVRDDSESDEPVRPTKKKRIRVTSTETLEENALEDVVMVVRDEEVEHPKSKRAEDAEVPKGKKADVVEVPKGKRIIFVSSLHFRILLLV